jgi:tRNA threonylcarbamoyladenosine biosynthesis protein TsaE
MTGLTYHANDEAATTALGTALAEHLPDGSVVALCGTLGAGKTRLVQAIAEATGVPRENVVSPTFVLVQEYRQGRRPIFHFDTYRLADDDEFLELGPDEYFEGEGLTLIEWADRVEACLPRERFNIQIEVTGETQRTFHLAASGERYQSALAELQNWLSSRSY